MNQINQLQPLAVGLYEKKRSVRRLKALSIALLVLNVVALTLIRLFADHGRFHF
ncbi:MAG: hypothetical protein JKY56_08700 [Kofleriaceae bacterium]|nr:hypothetical protein [Kofleriaceae bacterium]